ncbi:pyruvate dehydrogenase (acetyl-transferring) E1 component subunit alpha [Halalkalibacterium halodurans]|uniref:Pyruvate dehydrogenase E1 component subunit alpha n=3 Tax=Halalkalibacterium halodurans TaxID=86665 RepID=A0A0M0KD85_ALKHA|nr:pyruvate dehydrogenase (acetyl-transferring) E1 component subunit alpha [Halalkalibacterium halodurans]MDY7220721.1 pyruvate dehydrogenase (acetyl-transferring) E1 component subunit alpha [Halalkalibacterium halodurans]MDY7239960.1 pyruvate dehydrogenase (acetyl-transferring) E1 component subunit alpha [Halalkalibacterium halodurans]TPE68397.1 pyruvate dehydrogenase (acetyl-transferring) E1 component subunit alpha [Halalkalibacterium halodurans]
MAIENKGIQRELKHEENLFQVLTPKGECQYEGSEFLDKTFVLSMYKQMINCREFDEKALKLQRQGRIGTYASFKGQEACQIGGALALRPTDWLFPTYRDHAAISTHGQPWHRIFLYWMGHMDGSLSPDDRNILPPAVPIATQMLHAVGTAWADKLKGNPHVSLVFFGDGATSEGDFHEALNFAGVYQTPTIFFCQNNGYAISVPFEKQSASKTIKQRSVAYDMRGERVDGNDIFAVYLTVKRAIEQARKGRGPTLIEAVTTRFGSHTTADDAKKYRDQEEIERIWKEMQDPLTRLKAYIQAKGWLSEEEEAQMKAKIRETIDEELSMAEQYPKPSISQMFEHVYENQPWYVKEQEQELAELLGKEKR